ncbi:hypothetical protein CFP56_019810 [Quercus suber]|uniref:Uncharacterized protein n=1 Tax=Quercus suber TaxID=58331 RepID=A0AAW0M0L2_QUESU
MTHGFPQFHPSPQPPITLLPDQQLVSDIIVPKTRQWNRALLHNLFDHDTASFIQQIHIPFTPVADSTIWAKCPSGKFSVKSAYLADQNAKFTNSGWIHPVPGVIILKNRWFMLCLSTLLPLLYGGTQVSPSIYLPSHQSQHLNGLSPSLILCVSLVSAHQLAHLSPNLLQ